MEEWYVPTFCDLMKMRESAKKPVRWKCTAIHTENNQQLIIYYPVDDPTNCIAMPVKEFNHMFKHYGGDEEDLYIFREVS